MTDWADEKAQEWLDATEDGGFPVYCRHDPPPPGPRYECSECLAALLREVKISGEARVAAEQADEFHRGYQAALAEARKIVEFSRGAKTFCSCDSCGGWDAACDEILRRIEGLDG